MKVVTAVFLLLLTFLLTPMTPIDSTEDNKGLGFPDGRKIAQDSQGNLYVAYRKKHRADEQLRYHVFVAKLADAAKSADSGATWRILNDNQPIETIGDDTQRVPAIAIDSKDVIHVVWYGLDAKQGRNERQIKYLRSTNGGEAWTAWKNIVEVDGYRGQSLWQEHPVLHIGLDDTLYLVWQGKDPHHRKSQTKFSKSVDGGRNWSDWVNIHPATVQNYSRPTIVSTADGTIYVLAYRGMSTRQRLAWTHSLDGGESWSPWTAVSFGTADQRHVSVVVDGQNRLHAVWRQEPEGRNWPAMAQIHYSLFAGESWTWPKVVSLRAERHQLFPSLSLTTSGQLWVAWTETAIASDTYRDDPVEGNIVYALLGENGRWQPVNLTNNNHSLYATLPWSHHHSIAFDILWSQNSTTPYNLHHQRLNR